MSDPYILLTASEIGINEFTGFLTQTGAFLDPDHADEGRVSRGHFHVWIYLNSESHDDIDADISEQLAAKLGGLPKSSLVLELSRTHRADKLAIEVAIAFMKQWTAVLWDTNAQILDLRDLRQLQSEGKGIPQPERT